MEQLIPAAPERVWAVLADGWTYSDWVVGTAHIRDVDDGWPAPGTRIHHKAGPWPMSIHDHTRVLAAEPCAELYLHVRLWPYGAAKVRFTLRPVGNGTALTIAEDFDAGPLRWIRTKLNDLVLHRRNRESLRRLSDFAVRRQARQLGA